ncbi:MAG: rRNA maturation RNase YbeY [Elusimicrobia bacterium]|nr:rRNA maturation RNase YbeY [Elusimicrobiota bacterium]
MKITLFHGALLPASCRKERLFRAACAAALGRKKTSPGELNLIFMSNREIRRVNKQYLNHDFATDVIAFPYESAGPRGASQPFGDVYVSVDQARLQAKELGHSHLKELLTLAVHGTLHLMGFDDHAPADRKRMFARQDAIVAALLRE